MQFIYCSYSPNLSFFYLSALRPLREQGRQVLGEAPQEQLCRAQVEGGPQAQGEPDRAEGGLPGDGEQGPEGQDRGHAQGEQGHRRRGQGPLGEAQEAGAAAAAAAAREEEARKLIRKMIRKMILKYSRLSQTKGYVLYVDVCGQSI